LLPVPAQALPAEEQQASAPAVELVPATEVDLPKGQVTYGRPGDTASAATMASIINCTLYASDPFGAVNGNGWQQCTASTYQELDVTLQRQRWYGWQNMDVGSADVGASYVEADAYWNCAGSGTYTYRIVSNGYFVDADGRPYSSAVQSLNYYRITC
jgi:hypothetical protein